MRMVYIPREMTMEELEETLTKEMFEYIKTWFEDHPKKQVLKFKDGSLRKTPDGKKYQFCRK